MLPAQETGVGDTGQERGGLVVDMVGSAVQETRVGDTGQETVGSVVDMVGSAVQETRVGDTGQETVGSVVDMVGSAVQETRVGDTGQETVGSVVDTGWPAVATRTEISTTPPEKCFVIMRAKIPMFKLGDLDPKCPEIAWDNLRSNQAYPEFSSFLLDCRTCREDHQCLSDTCLKLYPDWFCKEVLVGKPNKWWDRGFIQSYGKLLYHARHGNKNPPDHSDPVHFVIYHSTHDRKDKLVKMELREGTKFLIHVAKDDSGTEGSHYAIMKFELEEKCIKVFEGIGSSYAWTKDATSILQRFCLIDESETIEAAHWTITPTIFIKQVDSVNCGPIACATLASLLLEEDAVFLLGQSGYFLPKNVPNLRSMVVAHYLNLVTRFGDRLYLSRSAKWVKKFCNTKPPFVPEWYVSSTTATPQDGDGFPPYPALPTLKSPSSYKTPPISKNFPDSRTSAERKLKDPP
jgi:hypothetical protein